MNHEKFLLKYTIKLLYKVTYFGGNIEITVFKSLKIFDVWTRVSTFQRATDCYQKFKFVYKGSYEDVLISS